MKLLLVLAGVTLASTAFAERWDRSNNPSNFNAITKNMMKFSLVDLPLEAKLQDESLGWSDSFWPSKRGGIAFRWNHPDPQPFTYMLHSKEQILKMSQEELSRLSPAELYDISQGDYRFRLTRKVHRKYSPRDLWWEGICHGWAQAAANYSEPDKVVVTNRDGVKVPFGSSDVKALLSMHDAYNSKGRYVRVGNRCRVWGKVEGEVLAPDGDVPPVSERDANRSECRDVNAGSFHVVLTNMIGINSQSFAADVDRYSDVWNQPVTSYKSMLHEEIALTDSDKRSGVFKKVRVTTTMVYSEELILYSPKAEASGYQGFISKEPVTGTPAQTYSEKNYEYILELDSFGNIIGGEWISETRPDMLWMKAKDARFRNGKFRLEGLNDIYKPIKR
jgi:hypothetical protein